MRRLSALICKSCTWTKFLILLIVLTAILDAAVVYAQQTIVTGVITDSQSTLGGVTVENMSTGDKTVSDGNGNFAIQANIGSKLRFTLIGFAPLVVDVQSTEKMTVEMEEDSSTLEDIVVVGYGTQKKETLTGSVATLNNADIVNTKSPSLAQAIQGKVAGLRIRQENGEPGSFANNINVRGLGTPLFVIDGVVRDGPGEFQRLNPDDIESISFLKDATAAIFGMNSANGAIIITTKQGAKDKTSFTVSHNLGISSPTDIPRMTTAGEYMTLRNEAEINAGRPPYITDEELAKWQAGEPGYETVDLWGAISNKNALQSQTNLSLNGGSERVTFFGSLGYSTDNSILKNNAVNYEKYTFRSNVTMNLTENLTGSINIGGRFDTSDKPWYDFFEAFKSTRVNPPLTSIYANDNPQYYNNFSYVVNPMLLIDKDYSGSRVNKDKNWQTQFQLEYKVPFIEGLRLKGMLAYDMNHNNNKVIRKEFATYTYDEYTGEYTEILANGPSTVSNSRDEFERLNIQAHANYEKTIAGDHHLTGLYVFERRQHMSTWMNGDRKFDYFSIGEIDNGRASDQYVGGSSAQEAFLSHIGRLTYSYKGKYLADAAFRYDGSYRYAPGKRWAFFPSASAAWRLSEENFIKDNLTFIYNWKLRGSIGRSGQDAGNAFQYLPYYGLNSGGYVFESGNYTTGVSTPGLINSNLTWVTVDMINLGMDFSVLQDKLSLEIDVYQRDRSGMLADRHGSLPNTFGTTLPQENLNSDRTRGIDFTILHKNRINDFHYNVGANFNLVRSYNIYVERGPFTSSYDRWRNESAYRWNDFVWGYMIDGRFTNQSQINTYPIQNGDNGNSRELPGDYIIKDLNEDGIINDLDRVPLFWNADPRVYFGLNLSANWKNVDLYMLFQGAAFYTVQFSEVYAEMLAFRGGNTPAYFYDRWHMVDANDPNTEWITGEWPAVRMVQDMGSFYTRDSEIWRRDASFLRLKSVELGYTFTQPALKKYGINNLRVYANGYNLLTITDPFVKPFDPEKITGAYNAGLNYPISKAFNFGLTVDF